jgi:hypothetical protein
MIRHFANESITTKTANISSHVGGNNEEIWIARASGRANIRLRQSCQKWIDRTDHLTKMSQEKVLKDIQKNDCLIPQERTVGAGESIIIEGPSGQLAESAQMQMT